MSPSTFNELLARQVGNEFAASHQYVAVAAWFDGQDLPQLAKHFYRQSLEERNHAMMMVRYILDRGQRIAIPGIEPVRNDFSNVEEPLALALTQEQEVTETLSSSSLPPGRKTTPWVSSSCSGSSKNKWRRSPQ